MQANSVKQIAEQTKKPKRKAPSTAFKPGQSGNPKGRPPSGKSEAELTREYLDSIDPKTGRTRGDVIRETKYELAKQGNMSAIESLETRAYGKPADTLKLESSALPPAGYMAILGIHGLQPEQPAIDTTAETIAAITAGEVE